MATNDRREPAVYVSVEDQSYIGTTTESGRSVYGVVLTDRGPHKRIVEVTSRGQYQRLFGVPDISKCSQTHYMLDAALQYTGKVYVCRVVPDDAFLANVVIKDTSSSLTITVSGEFVFTSGSAEIECPVEQSENINVGDYVFSESDDDTYALKVIDVDRTFDTAVITLESDYLGTPGTANLVKDGSVTIDGTFTTIDTSEETLGVNYTGYGEIQCSFDDMDKLTIGAWVYLTVDTVAEARQIVSLTDGASGGIVTLDSPYSGTIGSGSLRTFLPYSTDSVSNIESDASIIEGGDFVYHFYANGAGTYYNNIVVKGVRNFELEKMYVDDNGVPFYSYVFLDIYVYKSNENGTLTLLEGPWSVSLTRKTPSNEVIRDFISGTPIYIEDVINENSEFIRVVSGSQVEDLTNSVTGQQKRLQLMLELLRENPVNMNNVSKNGIYFSNGSDGTGQYDANGNINPSEQLLERISAAYDGSLTSLDGSIEMMPEFIFPVYEPDYIVSGGYPANIQLSAASLANMRQDCHHLGDTGNNNTNYLLDITARKSTVPWNFWTSSLYVQYRTISDSYTGRKFWISPVYHAIQAHLNVDNQYFIAEPVANLEKGAINDEIKLSYNTNHTTRGDLQDRELNYTIVESDGVYFSTQLTTWKRYSALKRQHIAKFTSYLFREIPKVLKNIIQRRATQYWLTQAQSILNNFMLKFQDGVATDRYACISSFNVALDFDKTRSELNVYITYAPILSIERINVFLTIPNVL